MKTYKGYAVDHLRFNSTQEIDEFIKSEAIRSFVNACKIFANDSCFEASIYCNMLAERLVKQFGLTWEQVEELEISAY